VSAICPVDSADGCIVLHVDTVVDAIDGGDVLIEGFVVHVLVLEGGKDGGCRQV
jgi:hypothetical protein